MDGLCLNFAQSTTKTQTDHQNEWKLTHKIQIEMWPELNQESTVNFDSIFTTLLKKKPALDIRNLDFKTEKLLLFLSEVIRIAFDVQNRVSQDSKPINLSHEFNENLLNE